MSGLRWQASCGTRSLEGAPAAAGERDGREGDAGAARVGAGSQRGHGADGAVQVGTFDGVATLRAKVRTLVAEVKLRAEGKAHQERASACARR